MKKLYDFRCKSGSIFERFADDEEKQVRCDCGLYAKRIISPIRSMLDPVSGDFPGATMKWIKEHEKRGKTG